MKTLFLNIQIDDCPLSDIEAIEKAIKQALKAYRRKSINITISDTFGSPLPEGPSE